MLSEEASSHYECIETECIPKAWVDLLLSWVNKCTEPPCEVPQLSPEALTAAANHYLADVAPGHPPLAPDDLEPFLVTHFNILRLRYLREPAEAGRRLQVMASALAFLCVVRGAAGRAEGDVCARLPPPHQLALLVFCERLADMEVTVHNVEMAITEACEAMEKCEEKLDEPMMTLLSDANMIGIASDVSGQSYRDTTAGMGGLRSSVMALAARAAVTSSGSWQAQVLPASPASPAASLSITTVLAQDESGDIIIPRKRSSILKASDGDSDANMDQIFAEEKHVKVSNDRLLAESENNAIALSVISETGDGDRKDSGDAAEEGPSKESKAFRRTGSFNPFKIANPFPARGLYIFHAGGFRRAPGYEGKKSKEGKWKVMAFSCCLGVVVILLILSLIFYFIYIENPKFKYNATSTRLKMQLVDGRRSDGLFTNENQKWMWECHKNVCQKVRGTEYKPNYYPSYGRCTLLCAGAPLWPRPTAPAQLGRALVALASDRVHYTVQAPSEEVQKYLTQAFGFFLKDLVTLEKQGAKSANRSLPLDLPLKTMHILARVQRDADPRLRLATDEAYELELGTDGARQMVYLSGGSFCGVRLALETLAQMIVADDSTGYLIGLNSALVRDSPSYPYRGLMLDTARNYIPIPDIVRTIDAMAASKLNTFHWRISDATSFPLLLPQLSEVFENGAYERALVYTREDVRAVAARGAARGVRVLLEVALPGPAGRAWAAHPDAACGAGRSPPCRDHLCTRLTMEQSFFDALQYLYTEILEMTSVDDIFHLSDGVFSLTNCHSLLEDREGFLSKALETLRLANQGVLPALPIVWFTGAGEAGAGAGGTGTPWGRPGAGGAGGGAWGRLGAQLHEWREGLTEHLLARYRLIQSTKWDLSCEMKNHRCYRYRTWQEMYEWRSWKAIDALNIEGGEAILWTDLVDSGTLDPHLWPRAAAVAERLWSDEALPSALTDQDYIRMDHHISRLSLRGVAATPLWPRWCRDHPRACLHALPPRQ